MDTTGALNYKWESSSFNKRYAGEPLEYTNCQRRMKSQKQTMSRNKVFGVFAIYFSLIILVSMFYFDGFKVNSFSSTSSTFTGLAEIVSKK